MPWKKMRLRDADVFVRVDAIGTPVSEAGRVEVHYAAGNSKAYRAAVANLGEIAATALLPDDHCTSESAAPAAPKKRTASARTASMTVDPGVASDAVIVYADGACSGNPGPAGLGVVVIDGRTRHERSEYLGHATNNVAELTAIARALDAITDPARPMVIHTDSQYSIGVLAQGWKPKKNQELIATLRARLATRPAVRFVYVKGHAGIVLNERADELAREAVTSRRTTAQTYSPQ